jgi:hypothetical protein
MRLTKTPGSSEIQGQAIDNESFVYLSAESGIRNRYVGEIDSSIVSIDTVITYQYFSKTEPRSGYPRNIDEMSYLPNEDVSYEMLRFDGKYKIQKVEGATTSGYFEPGKSKFRVSQVTVPDSEKRIVQDSNGIQIIRHQVFNEKDIESNIESSIENEVIEQEETEVMNTDDGLIDISNYTFDDESLLTDISRTFSMRRISVFVSIPEFGSTWYNQSFPFLSFKTI